MRKRLPILPMLLFPLLAGSCLRSRNLIANPGFESGSDKIPDSWAPQAYLNDADHFQYGADAEHRSGQRSLKITHPQPNDSWLTQDVPVAAGRVYKLSAWVKTEGVRPVNGNVGANVCLKESSIRTASLKGTQGWTPVECYFKTSPTRTIITVCCRLGSAGVLASGTAWFDDVELREVHLPPLADLPKY